ncbi:MAG: PTS sugar transporter subunit IIA [Wenzhouxiangellaceae bacterium]
MNRLLLVTHSGIATGLLATARSILGAARPVWSIEVGHDEDPDEAVTRLNRLLTRGPGLGPLLVLTDLPGATPHNLVCLALRRAGVQARVVSGLNLPMLLRVLTHLDDPLDRLTGLAAEGGRLAIIEEPVDGGD